MKILVAEDERISARRLQAMLESSGYEVVLAQDGLTAWNILQQSDAPHLAILDWMMPGMNGVELCRAIRAQRQEPYTFVILLTERSSQEDVLEGLDAGADDYLKKPFDASELQARLRAGRRVLGLMDEVITAREALRTQATHDGLTGLLNRAAGRDALCRDLARSQREGTSVGLILMDIDHFKQVNDTHGHAAGDAVLVEVANLLLGGARSYDAVTRYGGEEFLLVLPGVSDKDILEKANTLRQSIAEATIETPDGPVRVTVSMGAGVAEGWRLHDPDRLIRCVDEALYLAKHAGRNRVRVTTLESEPAVTGR